MAPQPSAGIDASDTSAFSISADTLIGAEFADGMILDDYIRVVGMPTGGAVRVSLGLVSNFADVHRFVCFAREFLDQCRREDEQVRGLPGAQLCRHGADRAEGASLRKRSREAVTRAHSQVSGSDAGSLDRPRAPG